MANAMLQQDDNYKSSRQDMLDLLHEHESKEKTTAAWESAAAQAHDAAACLQQLRAPNSPTSTATVPANGAAPVSIIRNTSKNNTTDALPPTTAQPPRKKSVDFSLDPPIVSDASADAGPPLKRARVGVEETPAADAAAPVTAAAAPTVVLTSVPWTPKQVVDAISTCISQHERLEAIEKALQTFDHDSQAAHNNEMGAGADAALAKHLTFLVHQLQLQEQQKKEGSDSKRGGSASGNTLHMEVSKTVHVLECLYRASSDIVGASFRRLGCPFLIDLLISLIQSEINQRFETTTVVTTKTVAPPGGPGDLPRDANAEKEMKQELDNGSSGDEAVALHTAAAALASGLVAVKREDTDEEDAASSNGDSITSVEISMAAEMSKVAAGNAVAPNAPMTSAATTTTTTTTYTRVIPSTPAGDMLLRKATKTLGHFARVGGATQALAHHPGLLGCLIRIVVTIRPNDCIPWEARLSALWTLANLACNSENMQMMVCTPGLVGALVEIASRPLQKPEGEQVDGGDATSLEYVMEVLRSRSIASRAILNLSWSPENKILLATDTRLLDLLMDLSDFHNNTSGLPLLVNGSRTVREIATSTRRHSVGALRNLAAAPRHTKIHLCDYRSGHLLNVLTDGALNDHDDQVKDRCFAAIHNLAIQDTAQKIVSHPALVLALKNILMTSPQSSYSNLNVIDHRRPWQQQQQQPNREGGSSPRSHASATLLVLERSITPDMDSFESLRELLQAANTTPNSVSEKAPAGTDSPSSDRMVTEVTAV